MTATQVSFLPSCPRRERPNIIPSSSVCRQLFGPVDHEQMRADLLRERKKLCDENTRTWNFDFENEIPLPGRYDWQRSCASSSREKPILSLPDRVSEMGTTERLACFNDSAETRTTRSTTSSGTMDYAISNDAKGDSLESSIRDPEKRLKRLRERKPSDKITDFLRSKKQRTTDCEKRSRHGRRKSTSKQTSMDLFVRKH